MRALNRENLGTYIIISIYLIFSLGVIYFISNTTSFYNADVTLDYDRVYSLDDMKYANKVYTSNQEANLTDLSFRHPLIPTFGKTFGYITQDILHFSNNTKYISILLMQVFVGIIGLIYLKKIASEIFKLDKKYIYLLMILFMFANSMVIFTYIVELYILSSTLILMLFYYASRQKLLLTSILSILIVGITITNAVIVVLFILLLIKGIKPKLKTIGICFLLGILTLLIVPSTRDLLFNLGTTIKTNNDAYSDNVGIKESVKRTFYYIFTAPFVGINTVNTSPYGLYENQCISFIPSGNILTKIFGLNIILLLTLSVIYGYKNKYTIACALTILFNVILHGIIQFGGNEAFLYSLHHIGIQILLIALLFISLKNTKFKNIAFYDLCFLVILMLVINIPNWYNLYIYIKPIVY